MDRFSPREEVEFHEEAFMQGVEARTYGFSENDSEANPYVENRRSWLYKSFIAGWADADQDIASGALPVQRKKGGKE